MHNSSGSETSGPYPLLAILAPAAALLLTWTVLQGVSMGVRTAIVAFLLLILAALARRMSRGHIWVAYGAGTVAVLLPLLVSVSARAPREAILLHWLSVVGVAGVVTYLVSVLHEQSRTIHRVDDLKANFVALANHELRTPVTILHSTLDTLVDDLRGQLTPQQEAFLEAARSSSGALAYLVEMMTQFEALERAPEPGSLYIEDLGTIVHTTALDLEHVFSHHGVRLSVRLDPDAAMSNVPKSYARIVLEQLLRNAAKFNYPGGNATVRARIEDRELVMEIEDDGWGIPPQDRAAIFDSFYQNGEVLARTANGIGLGLALVRIAVQKMQGSIEVSSLPGEGSTFTVRLPTLLLAGNSA